MTTNLTQHRIGHRRHARDELLAQRDRSHDPAERAVLDVDLAQLAGAVLARGEDQEQRTEWIAIYESATGKKWSGERELTSNAPVPVPPRRLPVEEQRRLEELAATLAPAQRDDAIRLYSLQAASGSGDMFALTEAEVAAAVLAEDRDAERTHLAELNSAIRDGRSALDRIASIPTN